MPGCAVRNLESRRGGVDIFFVVRPYAGEKGKNIRQRRLNNGRFPWKDRTILPLDGGAVAGRGA